MKSCLFLSAALAAVYTLLLFCPDFSPAILAFPLSAVFTFFFFLALFRFRKNTSRKNLALLRKLTEYAPFVYFALFVLRRTGEGRTPFALDAVSALLWTGITGLSIAALFQLGEKRVSRYWPALEKPEKERKTIGRQILEWIDALVQAACLVLLINLFFFQLYAIPSESMVPEFMVGDRVIVVKTPSGPRFPLSEAGIPRMRGYGRGDIVVFRNPHYNDGKRSEVRSFVSQLVYMLSFTSVNINRDGFGNIKADPLVKRITGVPGEKLMLVDGVLYARTKEQSEFRPVAEDERWAAWNLNALPASQRELVRVFPLSDEAYNLLLSVESLRANLDLAGAAQDARQMAEQFAAYKPAADTDASRANLEQIVPASRMEFSDLFLSNEEITRRLLTMNGGAAWFSAFLTDWTGNPDRGNLFDRRSANLNILAKLTFGRLVLRNAQLILENATAAEFRDDPQRRSLLADAEVYRFYISAHDQRNFGEFPAGENEFLPENCFFMMGDNRFNSLDMRHSYDVRLRPIDAGDRFSILYRSNLEPRWVHADEILGSAVFRFWPPARIGIPE